MAIGLEEVLPLLEGWLAVTPTAPGVGLHGGVDGAVLRSGRRESQQPV